MDVKTRRLPLQAPPPDIDFGSDWHPKEVVPQRRLLILAPNKNRLATLEQGPFWSL